jgi:hypothetical protein
MAMAPMYRCFGYLLAASILVSSAGVRSQSAELDMMNLTGDGNGFDMIVMPLAWRDEVPSANFFQRHGYKDNPISQHNNVVTKLIAATGARVDQEGNKPGAKELAAALR